MSAILPMPKHFFPDFMTLSHKVSIGGGDMKSFLFLVIQNEFFRKQYLLDHVLLAKHI